MEIRFEDGSSVELSLPTQLWIALSLSSVLYIAYYIASGILLRIWAVISWVLPAPKPTKPTKPSGDEEEVSLAKSEFRQQQQQQQPGVSIKKLLEDQKRLKGKQGAGHERHAQSKLFLNTLKGHTDAVNGLSFSADGQWLATACDDRTVRVYSLTDVTKNIGFKSKPLRKGAADVAFGADAQQLAVLTRGVVNSAGLCMLDLASKESDVVWEREDIHARAPGLCLRSAPSSKGGYGILLSSSNKTELRVYTSRGQDLGAIDTGGMTNYTAALSRDGRFVAAATFTSDVKVHEVTHDRLGQFTGLKKVVMTLKGHKSRVLCLDFSPDLTKMVTASADGTFKVWNIGVRYHMDEDPKVLLSTGLALTPGKCYTQLAWGPDGFIAGVYDSSIHFIDCRSGEVVDKIDGAHDAQITCVEWAPVKLNTPEGKVGVLATGSADSKVRLWKGPRTLV